MITFIRTMRDNIDQLTANNERQAQALQRQAEAYEQVTAQVADLQRQLEAARTAPSQTSEAQPTIGHTPALSSMPTSTPTLTNSSEREYSKPRLPDVDMFDRGTHEQYTQWKMRVQAKLFADDRAYPTQEYKAHYIITRTKGQAFDALRTLVTDFMAGNRPATTAELWTQLDKFFQDPTIKQKALHYLRTTKQGKGELLRHVQVFDLKFQEAGLSTSDDAQKIDYLKNSLNKDLLRYQAGHQPAQNETYDNFVQRMRVTWENLKAIEQLSSKRPMYTSPLPTPTQHAHDEMDWTPTVGAARPRTTREYWGSHTELTRRRQEGCCLRCGGREHYVRDCRATLTPRTSKPERQAKVAIAAPLEEDSDEEKEEL